MKTTELDILMLLSSGEITLEIANEHLTNANLPLISADNEHQSRELQVASSTEEEILEFLEIFGAEASKPASTELHSPVYGTSEDFKRWASLFRKQNE